MSRDSAPVIRCDSCRREEYGDAGEATQEFADYLRGQGWELEPDRCSTCVVGVDAYAGWTPEHDHRGGPF